MANIYYEIIEKNKFKLIIAYTKEYIYYAKFCDNQNTYATFINFLNKKFDKVIKNTLKSDYGMIIENYFEGIRIHPELPYKLSCKSIYKDILKEISKISYGQLVTYEELIEHTEKKLSYKLIDDAVRNNSISVIIPTHRLINNNKLLYIFCQNDKIKSDLIRLEGHTLEKKGRKNGQKKLYIIKE